MDVWILIGLFIFSSLLASAKEELSTCKLFGEAHTLCKYKGISKECKGLTRGLDNGQREEIVALHNEARSKLASGNERRSLDGPLPAASDMNELEWDEDLAAVAQRWADQCIPNAHDAMRSTGRFQFVGQNVATTWTSNKNSKPNWEHAVSLWYNEVKDYSSRDVMSFQAPTKPVVIGHFTQVIWAKTTKVGCAYTSFRDTTFNNIPIAHLYVCNYGTSGNFLGERLYTPGAPCSSCPKGTQCSTRFKGLCSAGGDDSPADSNTIADIDSNTKPVKTIHRFETASNSSRFFKAQLGIRPAKTVPVENTSLAKARNQSNLLTRLPLRRPVVQELTGRSVPSEKSEEPPNVSHIPIPCQFFGHAQSCEFEQHGEPWTVNDDGVSVQIASRKATELILTDVLDPRPSPSGRHCLRLEFIRFIPHSGDLAGVSVTAENLMVILSPSTGKEVQIPVATLSTNENEWLEAKVTLSGFRDRTKLTLRQSGPVLSRGKIPIMRGNVSIDVSIASISLSEDHC